MKHNDGEKLLWPKLLHVIFLLKFQNRFKKKIVGLMH